MTSLNTSDLLAEIKALRLEHLRLRGLVFALQAADATHRETTTNRQHTVAQAIASAEARELALDAVLTWRPR